MKNKTVLVTGATGFIGSALCQRLLAEGAHVLALARNPDKGRKLAETGVEVVAGDITDHNRMSELVADADVVMHLAAQLGAGSEDEYIAANVTATRHLAQASAQAGVGRFIYTSSIAALGPIGDEIVDETRVLTAYGDRYGDSKIAAEQAVVQVAEETGLEYAILRPGMVYGPHSQGWTLRMYRLVKSGNAPLINGGQGSSYPIYIDNLLDGYILAATQSAAANQAFNFVDDGPVTWAEYFGHFAAMLTDAQGEAPHMRRIAGWVVKFAVRWIDPFSRRRSLRYATNMLIGRGSISNQKARDLLGWQQRVSLREGMRRSEAWLREEGHL